MHSNYAKEGKTAAIVAYLSIIGVIIAYFLNNDAKNTFANFHIRQSLGVWITFYLLGALVSIFDSWFISFPFYIFIVILIVYGFITAIREEEKPVPFIGEQFQKWFNFI